jgi:hypothetical protein
MKIANLVNGDIEGEVEGEGRSRRSRLLTTKLTML